MANQQKVDLSGYARMAKGLRQEVGCLKGSIYPNNQKLETAGAKALTKAKKKAEVPKSNKIKNQISKATKTYGKANPIKNSYAMYKERD